MGSRTDRLTGTLTSWNDDRGFGFITPEQGGQAAFVHISAFPARATRPQVGEMLSFEGEYSEEGKRRALRVTPVSGRQTSQEDVYAASRAPSRRMASAGRSADSRRASGVASYVVLAIFIVAALGVNALWPLPLWAVGLYLGASILCFIVYAVDKSAAQSGRWRVSESTLLLLGLIGGWPGAIIAQQTLRHKTKKASFRKAFWGSVVVNVLVFAVFATPLFAQFVDASMRPLF